MGQSAIMQFREGVAVHRLLDFPALLARGWIGVFAYIRWDNGQAASLPPSST